MKIQIALASFLLVGCAAPTKTISFDSEPRGARVFLTYAANEKSAEAAKGRNFLGTTLQWTTETEGDGTFKPKGSDIPFYSDFVKGVVVFTAEPPSGPTNLYTRSQIFHMNATFQPGAPVPEGIFFDLTKKP